MSWKKIEKAVIEAFSILVHIELLRISFHHFPREGSILLSHESRLNLIFLKIPFLKTFDKFLDVIQVTAQKASTKSNEVYYNVKYHSIPIKSRASNPQMD